MTIDQIGADLKTLLGKEDGDGQRDELLGRTVDITMEELLQIIEAVKGGGLNGDGGNGTNDETGFRKVEVVEEDLPPIELASRSRRSEKARENWGKIGNTLVSENGLLRRMGRRMGRFLDGLGNTAVATAEVVLAPGAAVQDLRDATLRGLLEVQDAITPTLHGLAEDFGDAAQAMIDVTAQAYQDVTNGIGELTLQAAQEIEREVIQPGIEAARRGAARVGGTLGSAADTVGRTSESATRHGARAEGVVRAAQRVREMPARLASAVREEGLAVGGAYRDARFGGEGATEGEQGRRAEFELAAAQRKLEQLMAAIDDANARVEEAQARVDGRLETTESVRVELVPGLEGGIRALATRLNRFAAGPDAMRATLEATDPAEAAEAMVANGRNIAERGRRRVSVFERMRSVFA